MRNNNLKDETGVPDDLQAEWETDQLIALMGKYLGFRRGDSPFDDPRYLRWRMRELRKRPPNPEDWPPEKIRAMASRVLERGMAVGLSVVAHEGSCVERRPSMKVPTAKAVEMAGREQCMPLVEEAVAAGVGRALWDEACERWVERPPGLPAGKYLALPVTGDSMKPLVHAGDIVAVKIGPRVRRDTVIVARQADDSYVVKRVSEVRADVIQLSSLNPRYLPFWIPRENNAVLGTVVWRWCSHSRRQPGPAQVS